MAVLWVNVSVSKSAKASGTPTSIVVQRGSAQALGVSVAIDNSLITTQGQLKFALNAAFDHIMAHPQDMGIH